MILVHVVVVVAVVVVVVVVEDYHGTNFFICTALLQKEGVVVTPHSEIIVGD